MDCFAYLEEWQVLACREHVRIIWPVQIYTHLRDHHKAVSKPRAQEIAEELGARYTLVEQASARRPPHGVAAFDELGVQDGWQCFWPGCDDEGRDAIGPYRDTVVGHRRRVHGKVTSGRRDDSVRPVKMQTFFTARKGRVWFRVTLCSVGGVGGASSASGRDAVCRDSTGASSTSSGDLLNGGGPDSGGLDSGGSRGGLRRPVGLPKLAPAPQQSSTRAGPPVNIDQLKAEFKESLSYWEAGFRTVQGPAHASEDSPWLDRTGYSRHLIKLDKGWGKLLTSRQRQVAARGGGECADRGR